MSDSNSEQTGESSRKKVATDAGKVGRVRDWITALASIVTVAIALTALVFSKPADLRTWARIESHNYGVHIDSPRGGDVPHNVTISGTANIPPDWSLVVFVQDPDQFIYYKASSSVLIRANHRWTVNDTLGSDNATQRKNDINKPYRIYALVIDAQGQQQVEVAEKAAENSKSHEPALAALPHYTCDDVILVTLVS